MCTRLISATGMESIAILAVGFIPLSWPSYSWTIQEMVIEHTAIPTANEVAHSDVHIHVLAGAVDSMRWLHNISDSVAAQESLTIDVASSLMR